MKSYHAFLVRCWHEGVDAGKPGAAWRFVVMEIGAAPQSPRGFADWKQLVRYLATELEAGSLQDMLAPGDEDSPTQGESNDQGGI